MAGMDLVGALWEHSPLFVSREEFERTLDGWTLEPVHDAAGEVAVIFVVKGPEFHFCKLDETYQATREILRRYPGELIARHGYALTRTPKEDRRQRRFNERLGFYAVGEDEHDVHYRIDKLRNTKEAGCQ